MYTLYLQELVFHTDNATVCLLRFVKKILPGQAYMLSTYADETQLVLKTIC